MIENPNSSGQGHDPDHAGGRYHADLVAAGFAYSHSTPVHHGDHVFVHHTYKRGPRSVSAWRDYRPDGGWYWSASARPGSGRETRGSTRDALARYLRNARRR